jgi:hypothetical protein
LEQTCHHDGRPDSDDVLGVYTSKEKANGAVLNYLSGWDDFDELVRAIKAHCGHVLEKEGETQGRIRINSLSAGDECNTFDVEDGLLTVETNHDQSLFEGEQFRLHIVAMKLNQRPQQ